MPRPDPDLLLVTLTAEVAGHVCIALQQHRKWARTACLAVPDELDELERALAIRARRGQEGTPLEDLWSVRHAQTMSPRLLDYAAAATVLGVSERTVKRLVAAGALTPVRVLGAARLRVDQVDDYLARLTAESLTPSTKDVTPC